MPASALFRVGTARPSLDTGGGSIYVNFNAEEKQITFTGDVLRHDIDLARPFLAYLHRLPSADDYFFHVESWRKPDPTSEPVKIAETAWTKATGSELPITPPLG